MTCPSIDPRAFGHSKRRQENSVSKNSFRNRLAHAIANLAFHYIADDEYEKEIGGYMEYGIRSGARDFRKNISAPPILEELGLHDWRRIK